MLDKAKLRRQLRQIRKNLPQKIRQRAELKTNKILNSLIKRGKKIAIYVPIGSEMRLDHFVRTAQKRGVQLYTPYIETRQRRLWFTPYSPQQKPEQKRFSGSLNIPQFTGKRIRAQHLHIIIVPIVGIDQRGYRLGQGGGFYDATLAVQHPILQPHKVAVGFACQHLPHLPNEIHDCQMNDFICENGRITFPLIP